MPQGLQQGISHLGPLRTLHADLDAVWTAWKQWNALFKQPDNVSNSSTPIVLLSRTNNGSNLSISTYIIHIQRQMYDQSLFYLFEIASSFILHHTSTFLSLLIILISLHTQLFIFQFFKYICCWTPYQSHPLSQFVTLYIYDTAIHHNPPLSIHSTIAVPLHKAQTKLPKD